MKIDVRHSLFFAFFISVFSLPLHAQFHLNGNATQLNEDCFQLTQAVNWQVGSIWFTEKINLNESFQVIMDLKLGCRDADGADGIVFGFQPISTNIGVGGGGIGFLDVKPSLGIEFDTWRNDIYSDPSYDHVAIIQNGDLNHSSPNTLAGPVQANATNVNIEDCDFHELTVNWDADTKTLEVFFDCEPRLTYTGDIVNNIFGGNPEVFWGFTSATGGANNVHEVCFKYSTFLDGFEDVTICPGGQFQLEVSGGVQYEWTPATGLSNPNIPNPIASPDETTTYSVTVLDECNDSFFDTITVFVDGDTVFFDLGPDTALCENLLPALDATSFGDFSVEYQWSTGETSPKITPFSSGLYEVTVTIDDFCVADDRVNLELLPFPLVNLGPDLSLCLGETVVLDAGGILTDVTYVWQDGSTAQNYFVSEPGGVLRVHVTNECGTAKDQVLIEYQDCEEVYFPNAFSPNEDGVNDKFLPFDGGDVQLIEELYIFDRWGNIVFEMHDFPPNSFEFGWDGRIPNRRRAPAAVYTWMARVLFRNGVEEVKKGDVTLVR